MADETAQNGVEAAVVGLFSVALTVVAALAWSQVLDFDPCDNILKNAGTDCLGPGLTGIIVGGLVVFVGLSIAVGALRNGPRVYGRWIEPLLYCWLGLAMATTGSAVVYAQWLLGL